MMTGEMMVIALIETIIEYKKQMKFSTTSVKDKIEGDFFNNVKALYDKDKSLLNEATVMIVTGQTHYLETEEVKIRMECAGIWCNEPIYLQTLRIRFNLSINTEKDIDYLKRIISNVYIFIPNPGTFSMARIDREASIINFLIKMKSSNLICDRKLYDIASSISLTQPGKNIDSVIAYITLQKILGSKLKIPKIYKDVYSVATGIAEICNDGLQLWICNNTELKLRGLVNSLKDLGFIELHSILASFYLDLMNLIDSSQKTYKLFCKQASQEFSKLTMKYEKEFYNSSDMKLFEQKLSACL